MVNVPPAGAEQEVTARAHVWMLTTWQPHLTSLLIQNPTKVNEKVIELSSACAVLSSRAFTLIFKPSETQMILRVCSRTLQ